MVVTQNRFNVSNRILGNAFSGNINKNTEAQRVIDDKGLKKDEINLLKDSKVTFKEGLQLLFKGFKDTLKSCFTESIKHPLRSVAVIGLTTLGLLALPFVGISIATGAALLTVAFGVYSITKTSVHGYDAFKHAKNKDYDALRKDISKLGGDSFDLAFCLPFMSKGVQSLYKGIKYGGSTIGYNAELINEIKKPNLTFMQRFNEIGKANLRIMYEQMKRECNLAVAPELEFVNLNNNNSLFSEQVGGYNFLSGKIGIEEKFTNPLFINLTDNFLRHELEHFIQLKEIATNKQYGVIAIKNSIAEFIRRHFLDNPEEITFIGKPTLNQKAALVEKEVQKLLGNFNENFYNEVALRNTSTLPIARVEEYINGIKTYHIPAWYEFNYASSEKYRSNPLERDAFKAGNSYTGAINIKVPTMFSSEILPILTTRPDHSIATMVAQMFALQKKDDHKE